MWKVLFGLVRAAWLLRSARPLPVLATLLPALVMSLLIGGSAFLAPPASTVVLVCALLISVVGTLLTARARRSHP
jgi:uncharacterized membrane protein YczE